MTRIHGITRPLGFAFLAAIVGAGTPRADTWTADNGNGTFSNPLFYDEFSDCDMIRVGRDFCLTGTTMHSMPGLPILHSRDLVNWRFLAYATIGSILARRSGSTTESTRTGRASGRRRADSRGPHPNNRDGTRWDWRIAGARVGSRSPQAP